MDPEADVLDEVVADAVLAVLVVDDDVFAEPVSPETSPLVSLARDCGVSSTADTFTGVAVELVELFFTDADDPEPSDPLAVTVADSLDR